MRKFCTFVLVVSFFLSLPALALRYTYGFKVSKIKIIAERRPEWDMEVSDEVVKALCQPFSFLGKGTQSYAFISHDGQYVVKLFRNVKSPTNPRNVCLLHTAKISYEKLKEETGLIYVHLNETENALPILSLRDAVGRRMKLPLDRYRFALQKKASPFADTLEDAKCCPDAMRARINQVIELLCKRAAAGVRNTDPNMMRNFGFLQTCAVEFDFGSYQEDSNFNIQQEIKRYTDQLRKWLSSHCPEWVSYLDEQVAKQ